MLGPYLGLGLCNNSTPLPWYRQGAADGVNPSFWADYKNNRYATRKLASEVTSSSEVSLSRASTATYVDSAGIIRTAANDTARVTYNPATLARVGLLTETAATNLFLFSESLLGGGWGFSNVGVSGLTTPAPDSTGSMQKIIPSASASSHILFQNISVTSGSTYTQSAFVKASEYGFIQMAGSTGFNTTDLWVNFNLNTGAVASVGAGSAVGTYGIQAYPGGIYRVWITATATLTSASGRLLISVLDSDRAARVPSYTADGTSGLYIWGQQFEVGANPTSYIPTTNAAVIRAADLNVDITAMSSRAFSDLHTFSRAGTKTYFGSDGLLKTAAIDTPAFNYDPSTLTPLGPLIEPTATNICLQSQTFSSGTWVKDASSVTAKATTWIDGTNTMDLIVPDTSSANHRVKQTNITLTAGQVYTASSVVKRHSSYNYQLLFWNPSGNGFVNVDLQNGTIQSSGGPELVGATLRSLGNGFYRVSVTIQTVSGGVYQFMNYAISPGFVTVFTGDGTSGVYCDGCQVEQGFFASSFIPTTTAAITRAQDVCINGAGNVVNFASWYNTTANSVLAIHHALYAAGTALPNASVFCINDNSASNRSMLFRNFNGAATGKMIVTSGGVDSFSQNISAAAVNTMYKHAVAIAANDYALYENGVQLGIDASGALPVSPVQMSIGHCVVAGSPLDYLNGSVAELRIYPARISNSELARISS